MTQLIHHVPGRLRIRMRAIRQNAENAARVEALLQAEPGVVTAEANLITGSVVVRYDPKSTNAALILTLLHDRGYFRYDSLATQPLTSGVVEHVQNRVAKAVFWFCVEKAVERSVPLVLGALF